MKKVLIITYYWPPAGGPGIQRVLKFCKYLREFDWQPVVLTVQDGEYPARDESLLQQVPTGIPVYKTRSLEPFALFRKLSGQKSQAIPTFVLTEKSGGFVKKAASFIRGNFFIPDARIGWKPFAVWKGIDVIQQENIDLIFSTAPPMTTHLIAKELAKKAQLPWVADFRDPWTDVFYYHSLKRLAPALALDKRLERSVLRSANAVVTVSHTIVDLFQTKVDADYHVIANGYDESDYAASTAEKTDEKFIINHAGHLADNQNPHALWQALKRLVAINPDFADKLELHFYGSIHADVADAIHENGLQAFAKFYGYVPHQQIVSANQQAHILLFVVAQCAYANGILTSKLFDYMGATNPILGIGPVQGDAAKILQETHAGKMLDWNDEEGVLQFIKDTYEQQQLYTDADTTAYQRRNLTRNLADIFNQTYAE